MYSGSVSVHNDPISLNDTVKHFISVFLFPAVRMLTLSAVECDMWLRILEVGDGCVDCGVHFSCQLLKFAPLFFEYSSFPLVGDVYPIALSSNVFWWCILSCKSFSPLHFERIEPTGKFLKVQQWPCLAAFSRLFFYLKKLSPFRPKHFPMFYYLYSRVHLVAVVGYFIIAKWWKQNRN